MADQPSDRPPGAVAPKDLSSSSGMLSKILLPEILPHGVTRRCDAVLLPVYKFPQTSALRLLAQPWRLALQQSLNGLAVLGQHRDPDHALRKLDL